MFWKSKRTRVVTVAATVAAVGAATAGLASSALAASPLTVTAAPAPTSSDPAPTFAGQEDYDTTNSICPDVTVQIDGATNVAGTNQNTDPASCTWTYTASALAVGSHNYAVYDSTSTLVQAANFEIDPQVPAVVSNNDGLAVGDTATVKVTPVGADTQTFEQVNGGAWTDVTAEGWTHTYPLDHSGTWTVGYKAVLNGYESSVVTATWTVADAPAPSPSPTSTSTPAPVNLTVTPPTYELPDNSTTSTDLTFGVQVDQGVTAEFSLDNAYWSTVTGGQVTMTFPVGTHTLYFRARDGSGGTAATSETFTVVASASPSPSPSDSTTPAPSPSSSSTPGVANLSITEPVWEQPNNTTTQTDLTFGVSVDTGATAQYSTNGTFWSSVNGDSVVGTYGLGTQTIYFRVTDQSGNTNSTSVTFTVVAPTNTDPTPTPTDSPSATPTDSASPTPSDSSSTTPTPSDSASATPSESPSAPAPSDTPSATASPIPSDTASVTPTQSAAPTSDPSSPAAVEVVAPKTEAVTAGGTVTVTYTGFTPGETVEVWVHSTPILLFTAVADANGAVTANVTLPAGLEFGSHQIILKGLTSGVQFVTPVSVSAPTTGSLPVSGANVAGLLGVTIVLLAAGAATLAYQRRSSREKR